MSLRQNLISILFFPLFRQLLACIFATTSCTCHAETLTPSHSSNDVVRYDEFDVVIAGGSTAAFAAAVASAKTGARTALLEPTDWVGGQLTSSGVPAVDEAWHKIKDPETAIQLLDVSKWARDPLNMTPNFLSTLRGMNDCGDCWVSRFCFRPKLYLQEQLLPMQQAVNDKLVVFLETVVKNVDLDKSGAKICAITAIRRTPVVGRGYDRLPSDDLRDWYSPHSSDRFEKEVLKFGSCDSNAPIFIDATEWGELLALSGADYLQGVERVDGDPEGDDSCGQSIVYCFVQALNDRKMSQTEVQGDATGQGYGDFQGKPNAWPLIWTYRRISGRGNPAVGDLCLQNWEYSAKQGQGGNDYPSGYLFKPRNETVKELRDWQGGIALDVLSGAEQRAYGWHHWFRNQAPQPFHPDQFTLAGKELGTGHGLAKLPYIRDTRRSIGLDGFILKFADLTGPAIQKTGTKFPDRIALGAYPADVHPISTCNLPEYVRDAHDTLPFYIPFRALTHYRLDNLLVAGKTMAQSFLANSTTRLHPIEWSTGTAAGVAAAHMAETRKSSREALRSIEELQKLISHQTPIDWLEPTDASGEQRH